MGMIMQTVGAESEPEPQARDQNQDAVNRQNNIGKTQFPHLKNNIGVMV